MADAKLTDLAAATELEDADVFYVSQSGVSKKIPGAAVVRPNKLIDGALQFDGIWITASSGGALRFGGGTFNPVLPDANAFLDVTVTSVQFLGGDVAFRMPSNAGDLTFGGGSQSTPGVLAFLGPQATAASGAAGGDALFSGGKGDGAGRAGNVVLCLNPEAGQAVGHLGHANTQSGLTFAAMPNGKGFRVVDENNVVLGYLRLWDLGP